MAVTPSPNNSSIGATHRLARFWPLGPIFSMELRQMARRRRTYLLRFGYLGLMLAVLSMAWATMDAETRYAQRSLVAQAQTRAELGHAFLAIFAIFSVVAMHLIGPVLTSTAIGNEKLRRTLDALLMTPLTAWQIACGKLFSRTLTAFLLIGLTLPVLAIVRLLGGVPAEDLFGSVLLAAATALGSAAIGLLLSCFIRRAFAVILLAFLIESALYFFLPMLLTVLASVAVRSSGYSGTRSQGLWYFDTLAAANPLFTAFFRTVKPTGMMVDWWPAVTVQLGLAFGLLVLTTLALRRVARSVAAPVMSQGEGQTTAAITGIGPPPPPPPTGEGLVASPADPPALPIAKAIEAAPPKRSQKPVSDNPVVWRETRRPMLARHWQRVTAVCVTVGLLVASYLVFMAANGLQYAELQIGYALSMTTLMLLITVVLSATAIATEKESDTWTMLLASPLSGYAIVWGKFRGVLRRLRWPMLLVVGHFAIFTVCGVLSWSAFAVIVWTVAAFGLPWVATGLYFSLRCARTTTAVVMNLLMPLSFYAGVPMVLAFIDAFAAPGHQSKLVDLVCYYLPFYYQGTAIERLPAKLSRFSVSSRFTLPGSDHRIDNWVLLPLSLAVGTLLVMVTGLLLAALGARFDVIVGRARQRGRATPQADGGQAD